MQIITNHVYIHTMFCTKGCTYWILPEYEERLWRCIKDYGTRNNCPVRSIGGTQDHLHFIFTPLPSKSVDFVIKEIKKYTKAWMNDSFFGSKRPFEWQDGYGAFSTSRSKLKSLSDYIENQKIIHDGEMERWRDGEMERWRDGIFEMKGEKATKKLSSW